MNANPYLNLNDAAGAPREQVDLAPASAYEVVTREKLEHVAQDVAAIRERVDALFHLVIATLVVNLLLRMAGA